jgi:hypothetical protein
MGYPQADAAALGNRIAGGALCASV